MKHDRVQYKVNILDEQYTIISDEPFEHIMQASAKVDELIKKIVAKSSTADIKKAAILASLQIMSELINVKTAVAYDVHQQMNLLHNMEKAITLLNS